MTKTLKNSLIGTAIIAGVLLIIAAITAPRTEIAKEYVGDASLIVVSSFGDTVEVGDMQKVEWLSFNYGAEAVSVNIIRQVSSNPNRYELVRTVSAATIDDGEATWVPAASDTGSHTFIEVGCTLSAQACRASKTSQSLAVVNTGRFANTAAVFESIERLRNR